MQRFPQFVKRLNGHRTQLRCCDDRLFSSSSTEANESNISPSSLSKEDQHRRQILNASLMHVHQYGWTEEAIAQGVISAGFPPSYIGMMADSQNKPLCLISFFMEESNNQLKEKLRFFCERGGNDRVSPNRADVMEFAIRTRLGMVQQYVNTKRWHEGMALGAMYPSNAITTALQLEELMDIIANEMANTDAGTPTSQLHSNNLLQPLGQLDRIAIGAVYVATELHMLADTSNEFEDTWSFLKDRVGELELMATKQASSGLLSPEMAVAASAVASSMGGAVLSLFAPAAKMSVNSMTDTILPNMMNLINRQQQHSTTPPGTHSNDYDYEDLPPFDKSNNLMKK